MIDDQDTGTCGKPFPFAVSLSGWLHTPANAGPWWCQAWIRFHTVAHVCVDFGHCPASSESATVVRLTLGASTTPHILCICCLSELTFACYAAKPFFASHGTVEPCSIPPGDWCRLLSYLCSCDNIEYCTLQWAATLLLGFLCPMVCCD